MSEIEIPNNLKTKIDSIISEISLTDVSAIKSPDSIMNKLNDIKIEFEKLNKPVKLLSVDSKTIFKFGIFCDHFSHFELSKYFYRFFVNLNPPENLDVAWNNLGIVLEKLKKYTEAEAAYRSAISVNDKYIDAWNNLGKLLVLLKRFTRAETAFNKILELDSMNVSGLIGFGGILANLGKYKEAEEIFEKANSLSEEGSQNKAEATFGIGLIQEHNNEIEKALDKYSLVIDLDSNHLEAWNRIGIINLDKLHMFDKAEKAFKKILEKDSTNSTAWNNLGLVYKRIGKIDEAERAYKSAIENNPKYTVAYNNLGVLLKAAKKYEEAEEILQKAIKLDPKNNWLKSNLEYVQQFKKREEKRNRLERSKKIY